MNRKHRDLMLIFAVTIVVSLYPSWLIYKQYQQNRLNHDLLVAIKRNDEVAVVDLLAKGADPKARCCNGDTALSRAVRDKEEASVKFLQQAGVRE